VADADRGSEAGDEGPVQSRPAELGATRPLRVEHEAGSDVELRVAARIQAEPQVAAPLGTVGTLDGRIGVVGAAELARQLVHEPVALEPDLAFRPADEGALGGTLHPVRVGVVADALLDGG
jgi:hypothetical protein